MKRYANSGIPADRVAGDILGSRNHAPLRFCAIFLAITVCFSALTLAAQTTDFITLGNYQAHPTRILAKFKEGTKPMMSTAAVRQLRSRIHKQYKLVPGLAMFEEANALAPATLSADDEATRRSRLLSRIEAMKQSGLFEYVEPDYIHHAYLTPTDQAFVNGTLWGLRNLGLNGGKRGADISATNAWEITTGSTNVIVAVIDTGIRYTHNDLFTQMWHNPGETPGNMKDDDGNGFVDDVFGINAITGSGDPFDDNNHGSHVAGTIGAAANNGNPHVGVAWKVQLMACKFLSMQGSGTTSDAIVCIDYAVNNGAKILNNSWGGGPFERSLFDAIDRARGKGVLFVAAAGNSASDHDVVPEYPASYQLDNIIAVAAIDRSDRLADFSSFGQTTVHLGAPGVEIFSCSALSDSSYLVFQGTSQATPHVSGVAALILSQYPGADLDELRARIFAGTVPIPSLDIRTITGGRLNAYNSLTATGLGNLLVSVNPPSGSTILSASAQPVFVRVKDFFGVTNATVTGSLPNIRSLTFANDGQAPDALAGDPIYSALLQVPDSTGPLTMTLISSAPGKLTSTNTITYTVVPSPPNDNFASAAKLPGAGALVLSNNKFATIEPAEPFHAGLPTVAASLWWTLSPTTSTNVLIDASGSAIDAVVAVYTGPDLANLQQIAGAVGSFARKKPAFLTFKTQAGLGYFIAVASADTNSLGSIRLRVAPGGQLDSNPPNVFIANPSSGVSVSNKVVSITGTAFDPAPNSSGVVEVLVKVNDAIARSANGTTNWITETLLRPGRNVIQAVAVDAAGNQSPLDTVQISYLPVGAPNDLFINAAPLTALSGTTSVDTTSATKEPGEAPTIAGNSGGKSVWWRFVAPASGVLTLSTTNSNFDTLMALYTTNNAATNASITSLVEVASNDDVASGVTFSKITQAVTSRTYWIAVDGYNGAFGTANLTYNFAQSNIFHLTVNTIESGTVSPASGDFAAGSTVVLTATPSLNYEFVGWEGDITSSANPLSTVVNGNITLTARFRTHSYADGFESGGLSALHWIGSGDKPWVVQTNVVAFGRFAARSGEIIGGQSSGLILTDFTAGGVASFDYKVSSEAGWDWLEFYVNGTRQQRWSGEVGWATYQFTLPAGNFTLEWRYLKDAFGNVGLDAAFIDNLDLPRAAPSLGLMISTPSGFQLEFQGASPEAVRIEASTDLVAWQTITNYTVTSGGVIHFTDPQAPSVPFRFYRAVSP